MFTVLKKLDLAKEWAVSIDNIVQPYNPYHEMDIYQFCDKMNEIYLNINKDTI